MDIKMIDDKRRYKRDIALLQRTTEKPLLDNVIEVLKDVLVDLEKSEKKEEAKLISETSYNIEEFLNKPPPS